MLFHSQSYAAEFFNHLKDGKTESFEHTYQTELNSSDPKIKVVLEVTRSPKVFTYKIFSFSNDFKPLRAYNASYKKMDSNNQTTFKPIINVTFSKELPNLREIILPPTPYSDTYPSYLLIYGTLTNTNLPWITDKDDDSYLVTLTPLKNTEDQQPIAFEINSELRKHWKGILYPSETIEKAFTKFIHEAEKEGSRKTTFKKTLIID